MNPNRSRKPGREFRSVERPDQRELAGLITGLDRRPLSPPFPGSAGIESPVEQLAEVRATPVGQRRTRSQRPCGPATSAPATRDFRTRSAATSESVPDTSSPYRVNIARRRPAISAGFGMLDKGLKRPAQVFDLAQVADKVPVSFRGRQQRGKIGWRIRANPVVGLCDGEIGCCQVARRQDLLHVTKGGHGLLSLPLGCDGRPGPSSAPSADFRSQPPRTGFCRRASSINTPARHCRPPLPPLSLFGGLQLWQRLSYRPRRLYACGSQRRPATFAATAPALRDRSAEARTPGNTSCTVPASSGSVALFSIQPLQACCQVAPNSHHPYRLGVGPRVGRLPGQDHRQHRPQPEHRRARADPHGQSPARSSACSGGIAGQCSQDASPACAGKRTALQLRSGS